MEVFEQFRLLFIVLMAFLSYRYMNNTLTLPPSIDEEEEEQCQNDVENEHESESVDLANQQVVSSQQPEVEVFQVSEEKGQLPQIPEPEVISVDSNLDVQAEDDFQDYNQESQMNDEAEVSSTVLGNVENLQAVEPSEKAAKTKRIKKGKKKSNKRSTETIQIAGNIEGQYLIV